ncbi:MAG: hypothetical protein ACFFDW_08200 [Candidatus Thorarchaeota archaeon]
MTYLPHLEERNFWLWVLISFCTFGIGGIVYFYFNFADLNDLNAYPRPPEVPSTKIDIIIFVILCCCLPPIGFIVATYMKFNKLHSYLERFPVKGQIRVASGLSAVLVSLAGTIIGSVYSFAWKIKQAFYPTSGSMVMTILYVVTSLLSFGFAIYMLFLNYRWQEAFNQHARYLMSQQQPHPPPQQPYPQK